MKLIIISGPSGSGKTILSNQILKKLKNGIILNTDNYYKTGIKSQILSKIIDCYYDKKISFDFKLFKEDLDFILKNGYSNFSYEYDFKSKSVIKNIKKINDIKIVIVEGIFSTEIIKTLSNNISFLIQLDFSKELCMNRVINRDFLERGKSKNNARKDFLKGWELYNKNNYSFDSNNLLKTIVITKKVELNSLTTKINNLVFK